MDTANLIAIDTHTHLEVSCRNPFDSYGEEYDRAADKYFRSQPPADDAGDDRLLPREEDRLRQLHRRRRDADWAGAASRTRRSPRPRWRTRDIMIAFGSIDPHKGKMGAREARRLVEEFGVKGFKFHPTVQGFEPADRMAWPIYEVINEYKLPAVFHSGHSGIGSGMRCGGGLRLQNSNPMLLEDVAIAFPDMQIIIAHPSWPWQDEALSLAMHKPNIWIDLSGWSPKYFPPQLVQYANTLLKDRILFGSDFPLITPDRWIKDFEEAGFKDDVQPLILKDNAMRLLNLRVDAMQFYLNGYTPGDPDIRAAAPGAETRSAGLPDTVDVLIVGSGPAGTVLAAQLSTFPGISTRLDRAPRRPAAGRPGRRRRLPHGRDVRGLRPGRRSSSARPTGSTRPSSGARRRTTARGSCAPVASRTPRTACRRCRTSSSTRPACSSTCSTTCACRRRGSSPTTGSSSSP